MYHLNEPVCGDLELELLKEVIESNYLSVNGKYTTAFEEEFASLHGHTHGIAVQSGTAAVHTAMQAIELSPDELVAVPDYTCSGSASPVLQCGGRLLFVDVELETFGMSYTHLTQLYEAHPDIRAVVLVHIYGSPARDGLKIRDFCREKNISLIEDCCEAHGASYDSTTPVGSLGQVACFSLRSEKMIGVGEGGLVLCSDPRSYNRASWFVDRCKPLSGWEWKYLTDDVGCNYRLPHLLGAFAYGQLQRLTKFSSRRREIGQLYRELLPNVTWQDVSVGGVYWLNFLRFSVTIDRETIAGEPGGMNPSVKALGDTLFKRGVEVRPGFYPMRRHPAFNSWIVPDSIWNSDIVTYSGLCLPSHPSLTDDDVRAICRIVEDESANLALQ